MDDEDDDLSESGNHGASSDSEELSNEGEVQRDERFASAEEEGEDDDEIRADEDVVGMDGVAVSREKENYHKERGPASKNPTAFREDGPSSLGKLSSREDGEAAARLYRRTNCVPADTEIGDGFYDPGRNTGPLEPLASFYSHNNFGREVILVNSETDASLRALVREAEQEVGQAFVPSSKIPASLQNDKGQPLPGVHEVLLDRERVACLARFVTGRMGGVATKDGPSITQLTKENLKELKEQHGSNVIPIGDITPYGTCRHRAILFKVLGDRITPPVRCKLMRGSKGSELHAWNVVKMRKHDYILELLAKPGYLMRQGSESARDYVKMGGNERVESAQPSSEEERLLLRLLAGDLSEAQAPSQRGVALRRCHQSSDGARGGPQGERGAGGAGGEAGKRRKGGEHVVKRGKNADDDDEALYSVQVHELLLRCERGDVEGVRRVLGTLEEHELERLVNTPSSDWNGSLPLTGAAMGGFHEIVSLLLQAHAHVNTQTGRSERSALHFACHAASKETVEILLEAKAAVSQRDAAGWPPLFLAATHGDRPLLELLESSGADVTFCSQIGLVIHGKVAKGTSKYSRLKKSTEPHTIEYVRGCDALDCAKNNGQGKPFLYERFHQLHTRLVVEAYKALYAAVFKKEPEHAEAALAKFRSSFSSVGRFVTPPESREAFLAALRGQIGRLKGVPTLRFAPIKAKKPPSLRDYPRTWSYHFHAQKLARFEGSQDVRVLYLVSGQLFVAVGPDGVLERESFIKDENPEPRMSKVQKQSSMAAMGDMSKLEQGFIPAALQPGSLQGSSVREPAEGDSEEGGRAPSAEPHGGGRESREGAAPQPGGASPEEVLVI